MMEEILKQLKKALEYSNKAEGFLSPNEQVTLFSKALNVKGAIVEIGSWKGKSTIMLAYGSIAGNGNKVYAIDPHTGRPDVPEEYLKIDTFQEFQNNIKNAGVSNVVVPIVKKSEDAISDVTEPVSMLFIDGDHSYESTLKDLELWYPKLVDGGVVAFHDTLSKQLGVKKVVEKYVYKPSKFKFRVLFLVDSMLIAQKYDNIKLADKLKNYYILFLSQICTLSAKLPKPIKDIGRKIMDLIQ